MTDNAQFYPSPPDSPEQQLRDAQATITQLQSELALLKPIPSTDENGGLLRLAFDHMLEGCQLIGRDWRYLYLNDTAARYGRQSRDALIGQRVQAMYPGIETTPLFALLNRCMTERIAQDAAFEFTYPDGSRAWFEFRVQPIPVGILVLTQDISERQYAADRLRVNEEQFRLLVESVQDYAIYSLDPDGRIISWNAGARAIKGYTADEIIGQPFTRFFEDADQAANLPRRLLDVALEHGHVEDEGWRVRKDGSRFWAHVSITPVYSTQGAHIGFAKITRDRTVQRQSEDRIRALYRTLSVLSDINQTIVRVRHLPTLFQRACEIAVRQGGFPAAWIGLLSEDKLYLEPVALVGIPDNVLGSRMRLSDPDALRQSVSSIAIRTGKAIIINDLHTDDHLIIGREDLIRYGCRSVAYFPLIVGDEVRGTFNLYSTQADFFDDEELRLLLEMVGDISFAMQVAEQEAQREQAEADLKRMALELETRVQERTAELQAAKDRVEAILNNSLDPILFLDSDLHMVQSNAAFGTRLGFQAEGYPMPAIPLSDLVHPDDQARLRAVVEQTSADQRGTFFEARVRRRDGLHIDAEIGFSRIQHDGCVVSIHDISQRKAYERQLRYNASLQENVTDAVIATDLDYRIRSWNKAAERIYGWRADEVIGKLVNGVLHTRFRDEESAEQVSRQFIERGYWTDEVTQRRKDGTTLYVLSSAVLFRDDTGAPLGVVAVNHNITERREAEEALRQALETEKHMNALKSRFVSMASHEFRTPLAGILASADSLARYRHRMKDADIQARLDNIRQQVAHMTTIMENMLHLGRLQSGLTEVNAQETDLDALCREVITDFESQAEGRGRLIYACDGCPLVALVDPRLIRQVVTNLIANALKYSPPDTHVRVTLTADATQVRLAVADKGIGIPKEDFPRLFEPFHRASNVLDISGTGLGLSITQQAVEQHGGEIRVDSALGVGTTFTVLLPRGDMSR